MSFQLMLFPSRGMGDPPMGSCTHEHGAQPHQGKSEALFLPLPRPFGVIPMSFARRKASESVGKCRFPHPLLPRPLPPNPRPLHHLQPPPLPDTPSHTFSLPF